MVTITSQYANVMDSMFTLHSTGRKLKTVKIPLYKSATQHNFGPQAPIISQKGLDRLKIKMSGELSALHFGNVYLLVRKTVKLVLRQCTMLDQRPICFGHLAKSHFLVNVMVLAKFNFQDDLDKYIN